MPSIESNRSVHCLMGLPIDAVTMQGAVEEVRQAAFSNRRCFISTPNLNFVIAARSDPEFRRSVLHSDLSLADGMPLVWVSRLLGIPVRERVSGAGLFEQLQAHPGDPVTVYFFGGPDGAAQAACEKVNRQAGGLRCVGFDSPGFGSLEAMSSNAYIDKINQSGAMFVIVSLGAKKGQRWIEMNLQRLKAPVVCHLGAVVNFAAGTVDRAPRWVQVIGAEWLWRIAQEPQLWRRYWDDGRAFLAMTWRELLPLALQLRFSPGRGEGFEPKLLVDKGQGVRTLKFFGRWGTEDAGSVREVLAEARRSGDDLLIELTGTCRLGSAALGELLLAQAAMERMNQSMLVRASTAAAMGIRRFGAGYLLDTLA